MLEENDDNILYKLKNGLKLRLYTGKQNLIERQFLTTGSKEFTDVFQKEFPSINYTRGATEENIFEAAKIAYIPPCLRETAAIIEKAKKNDLPKLIQTEDIRSIIHSHSNWSDGSNTIEEMANECIKRGLEYLVISDHSQTAFYANGLKEDRIREQHRQIDALKANPVDKLSKSSKALKVIYLTMVAWITRKLY